MALLVHEIWEQPDGMTTGCLAGPDGDGARNQLGPDARLIEVFQASSHFEAMTTHNRRLGREAYTTVHEWDREPYPDSWAERQRASAPEWTQMHAERLVRR